nr:hypothetical protein [uncultured bacterium]
MGIASPKHRRNTTSLTPQLKRKVANSGGDHARSPLPVDGCVRNKLHIPGADSVFAAIRRDNGPTRDRSIMYGFHTGKTPYHALRSQPVTQCSIMSLHRQFRPIRHCREFPGPLDFSMPAPD